MQCAVCPVFQSVATCPVLQPMAQKLTTQDEVTPASALGTVLVCDVCTVTEIIKVASLKMCPACPLCMPHMARQAMWFR